MAKIFLSCLLPSTMVHALPSASLGFDDTQLASVKANMLQIANQSWELGTAAEALTELDASALSVISGRFPPPSELSAELSLSVGSALSIATTAVATKSPDSPMLADGEGSVGDPASLGVAVLMANWTRTNLTDMSLSTAASQQLDYLLNQAPRNTDGAISHRTDQVQLWADFVYMAPPFIAYYGALQEGDAGSTLLQAAYDQCRLYRNNLYDADSSLWRHIALGNGVDTNHWATGNGWAAGGMLRVLETFSHSPMAAEFSSQTNDLTSWVQEILSGVWTHQQANGTLLNVIDDPTSFADSSSTALLAAVTYRMAVLTNDYSQIASANNAMQLVQANVDQNGWLQNTVDPETFYSLTASGVYSPEGQAFVLLLQSAYRDYQSFISQ